MRKAQTIVEFALLMPIILMVVGSVLELGFWQIDKAHQDRATSVIANYIAQRKNDDSSWHSIIESELKECEVTISTQSHDIVRVQSSCPNRWQGLSPFISTPSPTISTEDAVPISIPTPSLVTPSFSLVPGASLSE